MEEEIDEGVGDLLRGVAAAERGQGPVQLDYRNASFLGKLLAAFDCFNLSSVCYNFDVLRSRIFSVLRYQNPSRCYVPKL